MKCDAFIRESIEQNLSRLQVSEQQKQRLLEEITGGREMKRKMPVSAALAAALILVSLTAFAAGISGVFGNMNWLGEVLPEDQPQQPAATPSPAPEGDSAELFALEQQIMDARADRELVYIEADNGGTWAPRTRQVDSLEAFGSLMATAPVLPVPEAIPEGYRLADGYVIFGCRPDGEYRLVSSETLAEGIVVHRYVVDETWDFISGYDLTFVGSEPEDYISIHVSLEGQTDLSEYSMGVSPGEQARALEVSGMDNAVAITSDDHTYLAMRRALDGPVDHLEFMPEDKAEVSAYAEVQVEVFSRRLGEAEIIGIFSGN